MPKKVISLRVDADDLVAIDLLAGASGLTRSRILDTLIRSFLREDFYLQRAVIRDALQRPMESGDE